MLTLIIVYITIGNNNNKYLTLSFKKKNKRRNKILVRLSQNAQYLIHQN